MSPDSSPQDTSQLPIIKVFIEVENGSCKRNLYDERTLEHLGSRQVSLPYPYPYGFILGTHAADGDSVDCYIITADRLKHGSIAQCVPAGLLEMEEDKEDDWKVLATLAGQEVVLDQELLELLRDFIDGIFARFPETTVHVGGLRSAQEVIRYIRRHRII